MLFRSAVRSLASGVRFDLGRIQSLGYRPAVDLDEGIRRTLHATGSPREEVTK